QLVTPFHPHSPHQVGDEQTCLAITAGADCRTTLITGEEGALSRYTYGTSLGDLAITCSSFRARATRDFSLIALTEIRRVWRLSVVCLVAKLMKCYNVCDLQLLHQVV
ncbi:unnamed protein product, partial [Ectocarpus sp. 13 AM-2016]